MFFLKQIKKNREYNINAEMIVAHELFAEFLEEPYTDKDELDMWKYVLNRLES